MICSIEFLERSELLVLKEDGELIVGYCLQGSDARLEHPSQHWG